MPSESNQHSVHDQMNEQAAANIAWASDRAGRAVAEFYEEKLRGLQEQLRASHSALGDANVLVERLEEQLDSARAALDRGAKDYVGLLEQLEAEQKRSAAYWKNLNDSLQANGQLKEQFEVARAALEQIAAGPSWIGRLDPKAHLSETQRFARDTLDSFPASEPKEEIYVRGERYSRLHANARPDGTVDEADVQRVPGDHSQADGAGQEAGAAGLRRPGEGGMDAGSGEAAGRTGSGLSDGSYQESSQR